MTTGVDVQNHLLLGLTITEADLLDCWARDDRYLYVSNGRYRFQVGILGALGSFPLPPRDALALLIMHRGNLPRNLLAQPVFSLADLERQLGPLVRLD